MAKLITNGFCDVFHRKGRKPRLGLFREGQDPLPVLSIGLHESLVEAFAGFRPPEFFVNLNPRNAEDLMLFPLRSGTSQALLFMGFMHGEVLLNLSRLRELKSPKGKEGQTLFKPQDAIPKRHRYILDYLNDRVPAAALLFPGDQLVSTGVPERDMLFVVTHVGGECLVAGHHPSTIVERGKMMDDWRQGHHIKFYDPAV